MKKNLKEPEVHFKKINSDPIVLYGENDEEIKFEKVALLEYKGKFYFVFVPVDLTFDTEVDVLIYHEVDGVKLEMVEDDELLKKLLDCYHQHRFEKAEADGEKLEIDEEKRQDFLKFGLPIFDYLSEYQFWMVKCCFEYDDVGRTMRNLKNLASRMMRLTDNGYHRRIIQQALDSAMDLPFLEMKMIYESKQE